MELLLVLLIIAGFVLLVAWGVAQVAGGIAGWIVAPLKDEEPDAVIQVEVERSEEESESKPKT